MNQLGNMISPQHMYALHIFVFLPVVYQPLWLVFSVLNILFKQNKGQQSCVHILWDILYLTQSAAEVSHTMPASKVHGANMGPTWTLSSPSVPHAGPMNLAIRDAPLAYDAYV